MIVIKGATEHHLKNINVTIPKNTLTVVTGVSGSGKSTLLFDVLAKEANRQYMEATGEKLEMVSPPKVNQIIGLAPCITIGQEGNNTNPRSTIGTFTNIYTKLRALFSLQGKRECPNCQNEVPASFGNASTFPCEYCGEALENMTAAYFSFNTVQGACQSCNGLGEQLTIQQEMIVDLSKSINDGAIFEWDQHYINRNKGVFEEAAKHYGFDFSYERPIESWQIEAREFLLYGANHVRFSHYYPNIEPPKTVSKGRFEGLLPNIERRYAEALAQSKEARFLKYFHMSTCRTCHGLQLRQEVQAVKINGFSIGEVSKWNLVYLKDFLLQLQNEVLVPQILSTVEKYIAIQIGYLSLNRTISSLSGGEYQRIRLASILNATLSGIIYILDEPTTGLHSSDTVALICTLKQIRDAGNTVIVIEHDVDVMKEADYIIEVGPLAGKDGGQIIASGTLQEILHNSKSVIKPYLQQVKPCVAELPSFTESIVIEKANTRNLKEIDVIIPKKALTSVVGVSGSGKSTLIFDYLTNNNNIKGLEEARIVRIEQKPIGRSPRSNAATYTDLFTPIRNAFSKQAKEQGLNIPAKDFSFNTIGGRCEKCQGAGVTEVQIAFIANIMIPCDLCLGKRYQSNILEVKIQGKTISDILEMTILEAYEIFEKHASIQKKLRVLMDVGLAYLPLGQPAPTLSGGEAQRLKIATELMTKQAQPTIYLMDEPTTGLHPRDIDTLMVCIKALIQAGHTVIAIEHHLDFIRMSDYVIEIGPYAGDLGGELIATGTPKDIKIKGIGVTAPLL